MRIYKWSTRILYPFLERHRKFEEDSHSNIQQCVKEEGSNGFSSLIRKFVWGHTYEGKAQSNLSSKLSRQAARLRSRIAADSITAGAPLAVYANVFPSCSFPSPPSSSQAGTRESNPRPRSIPPISPIHNRCHLSGQEP